MNSEQRSRATAFQALHRPGAVLVLPNAWDGASARIFAREGFAAVGTTSAGVAWALGHPDGQHVDRGTMLEAVGRIVRSVDVPVTVDIEKGYGRTVAEVCDTVRGVIEAGGVGINIEDAVLDPGRLVERIHAIREVAARAELPLFVNARTDTYLRGGAPPAACFEDTVARLTAYAQAGADGLFAPGLADLDTIARLARAVSRPLNVYAGAGVPSVPELAAAGVRRLSVGCGPMQATLALTRDIARELREHGTYGAFTERALAYGEVNALFG